MAKQSIIAVPTEFKDQNQVRQVLLRLIEEIDILKGYRGDGAAVTAETAAQINASLATIANQLNGLAVSNWNTAFSWGDHSQAGYVTDQEVEPLIAESLAELVLYLGLTPNNLTKAQALAMSTL